MDQLGLLHWSYAFGTVDPAMKTSPFPHLYQLLDGLSQGATCGVRILYNLYPWNYYDYLGGVE